MDCKFTVTCKCGCRSELTRDGKQWEFSKKFVCPNCGSHMPDAMMLQLSTVAGSLALLPAELDEFSLAISQIGVPDPES